METFIEDKHTTVNPDEVVNQDKTLGLIMDWDLARIKKYMANKAICDPAMVDFIEIEYKRFMYLCVISEDRKVPTSEEVDKMWHTHLLFTKNYISFCNAVRGEYIHHNPTTDENERAALQGVFEQLHYACIRSISENQAKCSGVLANKFVQKFVMTIPDNKSWAI